MLIQVIKALYMGLAFLLFGFGMLLEFIFLPVIIIFYKVVKKNNYPLHSFNRITLRIWLSILKIGRLFREGKVVGRPYDKTCIVISNHPGLFDIFLLIREIPEMSIMVKRTLVEKLPLGFIIRLSGYVLAPGANQPGPIRALNAAKDKIRGGLKFMVFPEGTRSPEGGLHRFKRGAFYLAKELNIPVQPVLIVNDPPLIPKGNPWYVLPRKRAYVSIEFLPLIYLGDDLNDDVKNIQNLYRKKLNLI